MTMSKLLLKPIETAKTPARRYSLRIEDGIEIYEHEAMHTCTVPVTMASLGGFFERTLASRGPRLIVDETCAYRETFISKARSEISELANLLNSIKGLSKA